MRFKKIFLVVTCIAIMYSVKAQEINWSPDGAGFVRFKEGNIIKVDHGCGS